MAKRGRPPKKSGGLTIKSRETQVFLGFIFLAIGVSLLLNNSLSGAVPEFFLRNFGSTTYILGPIFIIYGLRLIGINIFFTSDRFFTGSIMLLFVMLPLLTYFLPENVMQIRANLGEGGGVIGYTMYRYIEGIVGKPAGLGILIAFLFLSLSIVSSISLAKVGEAINTILTYLFNLSSTAVTSATDKLPKPEIVSNQLKGSILSQDKELDVENAFNPKVKEVDVEDMQLPELGGDEKTIKEGASDLKPKFSISYGRDLQSKGETDEETDTEGLSELDAEFKIRYKPRFKDWTFAPLDLLEKPVPDPFKEEDIYDKSKLIEQTLATFKIQARVAKIFVGPAIIQYALNLAPGTKVSKLSNLSKDLSLALAASSESIRIASIGGTSLVGIEVPRKQGHMVRIREVLESSEMSRDMRRLPLAIGKDIRGDIVVDDLQQMPHILVAGATGTGKSVTINDLIMGFIMKFTPDELKMILVDPKMVEMSVYNALPYLLTPVITDMDKVVQALDWAIFEMTQRYKLFKEKGVRNLDEFNESSTYRLPYIVIIIDEMADLILTKKAEVETKIVRLAQLARATGMHLILATQRPSVAVITGLIKANIPARISLGVTSSIDSRVILDGNGAESLIGKGDMLVKSPDAGKIRRVQAAFVSTKEIQRITEFIRDSIAKTHPEPDWYIQEIDQMSGGQPQEGGQLNADAMDDPLFRQAVSVVIQQGKASSSSLQRYLKIGFNRAARLIDQMTEMGIVAPGSGSKPREVLVSSMEEVFGSREKGDDPFGNPDD